MTAQKLEQRAGDFDRHKCMYDAPGRSRRFRHRIAAGAGVCVEARH